MAHRIYLDNSTTTQPAEGIYESMRPYFTDLWGIPSAPHEMGQELLMALDTAYGYLYKLLGASDAATVLFTSSGTEAANHVLMCTYLDKSRETGHNHFITSNVDEAPTIMGIGRLEHLGCVGTMVQPDHKGQVSAQAVRDAITPRTALVSLSWACGLTGIINPVEEIAAVCRERGIPLHLEASHILGKIYFDLDSVGADFISFNGANIHGPKGTGALYIKEGVRLSPFLLGGSEQAGLRAGEINLPGLIGLGEAAREMKESEDLSTMETARLRDKLERGIHAHVPDSVIFFRDSDRLPNVTSFGFPGVTSDALLYQLNRRRLFAGFGGGIFQRIGLLLEARGIEPPLSHTGISFSLSRYTTDEEVDLAIEIIAESVNQLKKLSSQIMNPYQSAYDSKGQS